MLYISFKDSFAPTLFCTYPSTYLKSKMTDVVNDKVGDDDDIVLKMKKFTENKTTLLTETIVTMTDDEVTDDEASHSRN